MPDYALNQIIQTLRDFVNQPFVQQRLMRDLGKWLQLCSCMDAIGDTEEAIESYRGKEYATTQGGHYLALYGLLQAMFVQQDAAVHLSESLGISHKLSDYPRLRQIRDIRNDSIGHPTKRDRNGKGAAKTYSFVSRIELQHGKFVLLILGEDGSSSYQEIEISDLIEDQVGLLQEMLTSVIQKLRQDDQASKEKFAVVKLAPIFESSTYHVEKIFEGTTSVDKAELAKLNVGMIQSMLDALEASLTERDIELSNLDSLGYTVEYARYALDALTQYFSDAVGGAPTNLESRGAYIFAWFVRDAVTQIKDVATAIDKDYAADADVD